MIAKCSNFKHVHTVLDKNILTAGGLGVAVIIKYLKKWPKASLTLALLKHAEESRQTDWNWCQKEHSASVSGSLKVIGSSDWSVTLSFLVILFVYNKTITHTF